MKRVLLRNTAWLVAERAIRFAASVLVMAVLARYLGPSRFGALNYAASLVSLLAPFLAMGMNRTLVREFVTDRESARALLRAAVRARLALAALMLAALLAGIAAMGATSSLVATLIAITACGLVLQAFEPFELWYQSMGRNQVPVLVKAGSLCATSVLKLVLVWIEAPVTAFAWAGVLELGINAAALAFSARSPGSNRDAGGAVALGRLLRECWPEIIAGAGASLCLRLDQFVLESTHGLAAVGVYAAGVRLSDVWYFAPAAIVTSYYPLLVAERSRDRARYVQVMQQMFLVVSLVCLAIVGATLLTADMLVHVVYGPQFEAAAMVLRIHVLGLLAMGFGVASGAWIFAEARAHISMWRTLMGVAVGVCANLLLVPPLGMPGAALATVLSLYAAYYLFDTILVDTRPVFVLKSHALRPRALGGFLRALTRDARRGFAAWRRRPRGGEPNDHA